MQRGNSMPVARAQRLGKRDLTPVPPIDEPAAPSERAALPEERPITVEINGHPVGRLLATPEDLEALAAGWVYAHAFARVPGEIRTVTARSSRVSVMIDAPGPGGKTWEALLAAGFDARQTRMPAALAGELAPLPGSREPGAVALAAEDAHALVERLFDQFRRERGCGGYHFAGGATERAAASIARDISRHNAVDKLIGRAILERRGEMPALLALSGRVSVDIVLKAWRAGIPIVATRSLPTAEAVALATHAGIAVAGRVLDGQPAVYAHGWRIGAGPVL